MALHVVQFVAGLLIVLLTLVDIFATILVPGPTDGGPRIGSRVRVLMMPLARLSARYSRSPGRRPSNSFAPFVFLILFATWLLLLLAGFGLLFLSQARHFSPVLAGWDDAFYFAGSSLLTLGVSEVDAHGPARWLLLAAGLSGFAVITTTITFLIQIQTALHQRETRVLTLNSIAGPAPSGLALLEAGAELGLTDGLGGLFIEWRDWAAAMLHSHLVSPMLIFLHSVDRQSDWLTALEAMLDAATLLMALTTSEAKGTATLLHRVGSRTAARLCDLLGVEPGEPAPLDEAAVRGMAARLAACGYPTVPVDATVTATLVRLRHDYAGRIASLAERIGADRTRPLA